jgi:peptidoglycan/LPS O-acetylase OafA/YrhL
VKEQIQLGTALPDLTGHRPSLGALTGIRFFAAMYVVLFHSRVGAIVKGHGFTAAGNLVQNGFLAVPLFFLLSGFILAYTYAGQIERPSNWRRFWEARFARIWPVYTLSLLLSSLPAFNHPHFSEMLAALCMVQAWNPWNPALAGTWNFVCWTLSTEAFFYLCFPFAQIWIEKRSIKALFLILVAMFAFCLTVNSAAHTLGSPMGSVTRYMPLPILHIGEFFSGVCIGNYVLRRIDAGGNALPGRGAWTYLSVLLTVTLLCHLPGRWTAVVVLGFSALIFGLASERTLLSRFLSTRTMLLGGGISYSIYLMQMPVKQWVMLAAPHLHLQSNALRLVVNAIVLLGISLVLFEAVEQPARKTLRLLFARLEYRRRKNVQNMGATT